MSIYSGVMAEGIGEVIFASSEWVAIAAEELKKLLAASELTSTCFTLCEVGHNAPVFMNSGDKLAWFAKIDGGKVEVGAGELTEKECDYKVECDHAVISNIARIVYDGNDPGKVAAAMAALNRQTRWRIHGQAPESRDPLSAVLSQFHDVMAPYTMPRVPWMSAEWVELVRRFLSARSQSDKYRDDIVDVNFVFAEEFVEPPEYVGTQSEAAGFWVNCIQGELEIGSGPLPDHLGPADYYTKGIYAAVLPVGRTVNAVMTDKDQADQAAYSKQALGFDKKRHLAGAKQSSPSGNGDMPRALMRIFMPLHDVISKRTSGELPADYDANVPAKWCVPLGFDRASGYDASWLRYDRVDCYGHSLD